MSVYVGFTSVNFKKNKSLSLKDIKIVEQDIYNHIMTRIGERVMMPTFGTRIPDLIFEPLDEVAVSIVKQDLTTVFKYDPRVELRDLQVVPLYENSAIIAFVTAYYFELDFTATYDIKIQFNS